MLTTVKLYGELGKKYGKMHKFAVKSVPEALRALKANFKDFYKHIDPKGKYAVFVDGENVPTEEIGQVIGSGKTIKIVPVAAGSDELLAIIIGALLIASGQLWAVQLGLEGMAATFVTAVGMSLVMQGITSLMYKEQDAPREAETDMSKHFNGAYNTTAEGMPVPVGYGRVLTGSAVISARITSVAKDLNSGEVLNAPDRLATRTTNNFSGEIGDLAEVTQYTVAVGSI